MSTKKAKKTRVIKFDRFGSKFSLRLVVVFALIFGITGTFLLFLTRAQSSAPRTGSVRIAVIVAQFSDAPQSVVTPPNGDPMTLAKENMAKVDAFYREQSYGKLQLTSDVYGLYTIPYTSDYLTNITASLEAAKNAGVDLSAYQQFYYLYPPPSPGGPLANNWGTEYNWQVIAHEMGHHIFGHLEHDNGVICDQTTANCSVREYGNFTSIMANGGGHFSASTKIKFGWLQPTLVQTSGEYTIEPLETPITGTKALQIKTCSRKVCRAYLLEYRQPIGFDDQRRIGPYNWDNVFGGVLFYTEDYNRNNSGIRLQMTPYTAGTPQAPALPVGQTVCDSDIKVRVKVISVDASGAKVRVDLGARCQRGETPLQLYPVAV